MASGDRRRRGVEWIYWTDLRVMMVVRRRGHNRAQSVHPRKALAAQGRRHLSPVVVRTVRSVKGIRIREWLSDEAIQTGRTETGFKVRCGLRSGVHRVALFLSPFCPPILEPDLKIKNIILQVCALNLI